MTITNWFIAIVRNFQTFSTVLRCFYYFCLAKITWCWQKKKNVFYIATFSAVFMLINAIYWIIDYPVATLLLFTGQYHSRVARVMLHWYTLVNIFIVLTNDNFVSTRTVADSKFISWNQLNYTDIIILIYIIYNAYNFYHGLISAYSLPPLPFRFVLTRTVFRGLAKTVHSCRYRNTIGCTNTTRVSRNEGLVS